ncbi:MAG TPA: SDR family oxidoreductase [Mycobacteriales bacterium]|jgi:NAD(P)-dependent dehydrogenase (short-subunit alcohol dehydrogenase family)
MARLADKVAVVTGASSGIGRAVAERFLAEGARVVAVGRDTGKLAALEKDLDAGDALLTHSADLSSNEQSRTVFEAAEAAFGGVDVLVNNAGVGYSYKDVRPGSMDTLADTPAEEWDHVMGINLGSVVNCSRHAIAAMRRRGGGSIVNISSILGLVGNPDAHAYTTAKGAIINLTRSLATAHARENIRANTVAPGYIETPMVAAYVDFLNSEEYRYQWNPSGRTGRSEEIANGVLFLASDEASYCNGAVLVIDGGALAAAP